MSRSRFTQASREAARIVRQYATAVLRESDGHPERIGSTLRDIIIARLRHGVGPRYYSLFELKRVPESEWDDFVTDDPWFKDLLRSMSPEEVHAIANDKALFHAHCLAYRLPTVPTVCLVAANSSLAYPSIRVVRDRVDWHLAMREAPDELFVKPIDGTFGEGAFSASRASGRVSYAGQSGSLDDLFDYIQHAEGGEKGWLVQHRLQCHPSLAPIMAKGVGTVRAVSCIDERGARLLLALLKITVGTNETDNFHHGTTGNLVAPIDVFTGTVAAARGSLRTDWPAMTEMEVHPDTGNRIDGFVIPCWSEIVDMVLRAQRSLPKLKGTGWDVAVTPDGPVLLETNAFFSVDILQVAFRRGLKGLLLHELGVAPAER